MLQPGWLKTTSIYYLTVLEAGGLKSRCGQGHAPSEGSRGGSFLASFSFQWLQMPSVRGPIPQVSVWSSQASSLGLVLPPSAPGAPLPSSPGAWCSCQPRAPFSPAAPHSALPSSAFLSRDRPPQEGSGPLRRVGVAVMKNQSS